MNEQVNSNSGTKILVVCTECVMLVSAIVLAIAMFGGSIAKTFGWRSKGWLIEHTMPVIIVSTIVLFSTAGLFFFLKQREENLKSNVDPTADWVEDPSIQPCFDLFNCAMNAIANGSRCTAFSWLGSADAVDYHSGQYFCSWYAKGIEASVENGNLSFNNFHFNTPDLAEDSFKSFVGLFSIQDKTIRIEHDWTEKQLVAAIGEPDDREDRSESDHPESVTFEINNRPFVFLFREDGLIESLIVPVE